MANLRKSLEAMEVLCGETIEAVVVGRHDRLRWDSPTADDEGVVLSREAGLAKLDEEYDSGYGSADCRPFIAWFPSRIAFVAEYDGSTEVAWTPRNPTAIVPEFSGQ